MIKLLIIAMKKNGTKKLITHFSFLEPFYRA